MEKMLWLPRIKDQATSTGKFEYADFEANPQIQCGLFHISKSSQTLHYPKISSPHKSHF